MSQVSSEVLDQLEQQQTLIAQLKHLVRQNEEELKSKEKDLEDTNSKFKKFKLQSRAKINQLSSQMKESTKDKDDESEDSSTHSAESSDQGSRAKVILLKKQLEDSRLRFEKQENHMKDQITCLQSTVQQLTQSKSEIPQVPQHKSEGTRSETTISSDKGQQELYAQIVYKDSKILDLNNQILELERRIMDLQENVREKDQVLVTRNKAIQLMTEEMNRRSQAVEDELSETRREMREMQDRFASAESLWLEEKNGLQEILQSVREDESQHAQKEIKSYEAARLDLAKRNAELQEKVVILQERLQAVGSQQQDSLHTIEELKKEAAVKEQEMEELRRSSEEAANTTDNRILKARAKERSKLKVAERQIEELKKLSQEHEKQTTELKESLNNSLADKAALEEKLQDLELIRNEIASKQEGNREQDSKDKADLSAHIGDLEENIVQHVSRIQELESLLTTMSNTITGLENRIKSVTEDKTELESQVEQFKINANKHEQKITEQLLNIQNLMEKKEAMEECLKDIFSLSETENFEEFRSKWHQQDHIISDLNQKCVENEIKMKDKEQLLNSTLLDKEHLQGNLQDVLRESTEFRNKISELEWSLKSLQEGSHLLNNAKAEMEFENESLQKKLSIKDKRISSLEDQFHMAQVAVQEVESSNSVLENKVKEVLSRCKVQDLTELSEKWESQEQTVRNLIDEMEVKVKGFSEQELSFTSTISNLKGQHDEMESKMKSLSFELDEKSRMLKALEDFKNASSQENQSKENAYHEQFSQFQTEIASLRKFLDDKTTENEKYEEAVRNLNENNKRLSNDLEYSQKTINEMKDQFECDLSKEKQLYEEDKTHLNQKLSFLEAQVADLEGNIQTLTNETSELKHILQAKETQILELQETHHCISNQYNDLDQNLKAALESLSAEKIITTTLKDETAQLESELKTIRTEHHAKSVELENKILETSTLHFQLQELAQKCKDTEEINQNICKQLESVQSLKAALESQLAVSESQAGIESTLFQEKYKELEQSHQAECGSLKQEIQALVLKHKELEAAAEIFCTESNTWKSKFAESLESITDSESALAALVMDKDKLLQECARLSEENDNLNTSFQTLEQTNSKFVNLLTNECETLQQRLVSLCQESGNVSAALGNHFTCLKAVSSENVLEEFDKSVIGVKPLTFDSDLRQRLCIENDDFKIAQHNILQAIKQQSLQLQHVDAHLQSVTTSFESIRTFSETLINKFNSVLEKLSESSIAVNSLQDQITSLQNENDRIVSLSQGLTAKVKNLSKELRVTRNQCSTLQSEQTSLTSDYESKVDKLNSDLLSSSQHVQTLENAQSQLQSECHTLKTQIQKLNEMIQTLQNSENLLLTEKEEVEKRANKLEEQQSSLSSRLQEEIEKGIRVGQLESDLSFAQGEISRFQTELATMSSANKDLHSSNQSLQNKCANLNEVISGLKYTSDENLSQLYNVNIELKEKTEVLEKENANLNEKLLSLENQISILNTERSVLADKCENMEVTIAKIENQFCELKKLSDELANKKSSLEIELVSVRADLDTSTAEFQNRVNELENQLESLATKYNDIKEESSANELSLKAQLQQMESCVPELKNQLSALNNEYVALQQLYANDQQIKQALENELTDSKNQLKAFEEKTLKLESEFSVVNNEHISLQQQSSYEQLTKQTLENELAKVQKELSEYVELYTEKEKILLNINDMYNETFKELEAMKQKFSDLQDKSMSEQQKTLLQLEQAEQQVNEHKQQIVLKESDCRKWEEATTNVQRELTNYQEDLKLANKQLAHLANDVQEKDNLISSLTQQLNGKSDEIAKLVEKFDQCESREFAYLNLSSQLENAQEVIGNYEQVLQEKSNECSVLSLKVEELDQLRNELSQNMNTLCEKEEEIKQLKQALSGHADDVQGLEEVTKFQNSLIKSLKTMSESVGSENGPVLELQLEKVFKNPHELDVNETYKLAMDLTSVLQEKHETLLGFRRKIETVDLSMKALQDTFAVTHEFPFSEKKFKDGDFSSDIENLFVSLKNENTKLKHQLDELNKTREAKCSDSFDGLPNSESFESNDIETKANLVNDCYQQNSHEQRVQKEEATLLYSSINHNNNNISVNDHMAQEIEDIKVENKKLYDINEANKVKMGKMLMKLKQLKDKNDLFTQDLKDMSSLKSSLQQQTHELEESKNQNFALNAKVRDLESNQNRLECEFSKLGEEKVHLHKQCEEAESRIQELQSLLQQQQADFMNIRSEKVRLEREKDSLLNQLEVTKQQSDLIASDNDTFLTLVEELKTSKKQLESEVQKLKSALVQNQNDHSQEVQENTRVVDELKSDVLAKNKQILDLGQKLGDRQTVIDDLTQQNNKLGTELDEFKQKQPVEVTEIIVSDRHTKEESRLVRSSSKDSTLLSEEKSTELNATIEHLQAQNLHLRRTLSEFETVKSNYEKIVQEKEALGLEVRNLSSELTAKTSECDNSAKTLHQKLQEQNKLLESNLRTKVSENENLKTYCERLEGDVKKLKSTVSSVSTELVNHKQQSISDLQRLEFELQTQTEHFQKLQSELVVVCEERDKHHRNLTDALQVMEKLKAELSSVRDVNSTETNELKKNIDHEIAQRLALNQHYQELHASHHMLQTNMESLTLERNRIVADLQAEVSHRGALEKDLQDLRHREDSLALERRQLDILKSQEAMRDAQQRKREEHLQRELQHAMETIHQQGLRSEEQGLELGKVLEERDALKQQLTVQHKLSDSRKSSAALQNENEQSLLAKTLVEEATAELQQKLEALQAELDLEKHRRLLLQEEMTTNIPSTSDSFGENEYKLIIEEEPEYIPERSHLISRNVQTHWTKVHRWLLGRKNYFRNTVKKRQHWKLIFYAYVAILHIWIMFCLF